MKSFDFDFEAVLTVREQEERQIQQRLAREEQELQRMMDQIQHQQRELSRAQQDLKSLQHGEIQIDLLLDQKQYVNHLRERFSEHTEELQEQLDVVKQVRQELVEAAKEKQAMEQLKEREWEQYVDEYYREEQNFLDDITQSMHIMKKKNERERKQ